MQRECDSLPTSLGIVNFRCRAVCSPNDFDTAIFPRNVSPVPRGKNFFFHSMNMILSREFMQQHIIDKKLQDIACPVSLFVAITGGLIGRTRLTQALQGEKPLDQNLVDKLVV